MKSKPLRARLRNTCSEAAPSGTFSIYAMCEFATCSQRYTRPSNWAWLHPPSLCGPMRTIATLNLPATTSGIWVPAAAPASQPAALDGAGLALAGAALALALAGGALALAAAGLALAPPDEQAREAAHDVVVLSPRQVAARDDARLAAAVWQPGGGVLERHAARQVVDHLGHDIGPQADAAHGRRPDLQVVHHELSL